MKYEGPTFRDFEHILTQIKRAANATLPPDFSRVNVRKIARVNG